MEAQIQEPVYPSRHECRVWALIRLMTLNLRLAALMPVNYKRCIAAPQWCTVCSSDLSHGRLRSDRRCEVGLYAHLFEHDADADIAVELLDLAVFHRPEVGAWDVKLGSGRLVYACGRLERHR